MTAVFTLLDFLYGSGLGSSSRYFLHGILLYVCGRAGRSAADPTVAFTVGSLAAANLAATRRATACDSGP